jgi:hypothetical protein
MKKSKTEVSMNDEILNEFADLIIKCYDENPKSKLNLTLTNYELFGSISIIPARKTDKFSIDIHKIFKVYESIDCCVVSNSVTRKNKTNLCIPYLRVMGRFKNRAIMVDAYLAK